MAALTPSNPDQKQTKNKQRDRIAILFFIVTIIFGAAEVWACRYSMGPDSMDYLDIARELAAGRYAAIANGYWGTLISVILAPIFRFHLRPQNELLFAHAIGIPILLAAFFSFRFCLHCLLDRASSQVAGNSSSSLPDWSLCVLGYSLFLWSSLTMVGAEEIGPDLLVTVFIFLAAGLLSRMRRESSPLAFVLFGAILGAGYWSKAIMFPIGLTFLAVSILELRNWRKNLLSAAAFAIVALPLILMLSLPRGRFTFGDSGLLNYSSLVSPGGRVINWQGIPPASGVPRHPTRKVSDLPPAYEFNGPVAGTYPPSFDPSYWNEGRRATFNLRSQLSVILHHIPAVLELMFVAEPSLTAGLLFLCLWNSAGFLKGLWRNWDLLAVSIAIISLYMLVHFETRFAGAFVVLIWLAAFQAVRLPAREDSKRIAALSVIALVVVMLLTFVSNIAKKIANGCPGSAIAELHMAAELPIAPGTEIAVIGAGNFSYWAYFAHLRIVADVMLPDEAQFWTLSELQRQTVYDAFQKAGARWIIAQPPSFAVNMPDSPWDRIGSTSYYRYSLINGR